MIKPKTRKEKLLSAIANDAPVTIQPKNREELFLAQIAEKTSNVPKPLTYDYMPEGYPTKTVVPEVVHLKDVEVNLEMSGSNYTATVDLPDDNACVPFVYGEYYDVYLNDSKLSVKATGESVLGSLSQTPFVQCMLSNENKTMTVRTKYISGAKTVRIVKPETVVYKPIDECFLPVLTSPNGTKYKLSVADDATLSVVLAE